MSCSRRLRIVSFTLPVVPRDMEAYLRGNHPDPRRGALGCCRRRCPGQARNAALGQPAWAGWHGGTAPGAHQRYPRRSRRRCISPPRDPPWRIAGDETALRLPPLLPSRAARDKGDSRRAALGNPCTTSRSVVTGGRRQTVRHGAWRGRVECRESVEAAAHPEWPARGWRLPMAAGRCYRTRAACDGRSANITASHAAHQHLTKRSASVPTRRVFWSCRRAPSPRSGGVSQYTSRVECKRYWVQWKQAWRTRSSLPNALAVGRPASAMTRNHRGRGRAGSSAVQ
jgi:hypothetical protein